MLKQLNAEIVRLTANGVNANGKLKQYNDIVASAQKKINEINTEIAKINKDIAANKTAIDALVSKKAVAVEEVKKNTKETITTTPSKDLYI